MQQDVSSPHWVERRHPRSGDLCPLYPRKRTEHRPVFSSTVQPQSAVYILFLKAGIACRPLGLLAAARRSASQPMNASTITKAMKILRKVLMTQLSSAAATHQRIVDQQHNDRSCNCDDHAPDVQAGNAGRPK